MAEYIERERLKAVIERNFGHTCGAVTVQQLIDIQPAADVAPVVHGEWSGCKFDRFDGTYEEQCSICKNWAYGMNYCPNCGAKMDGGGKDNG